jgi:hypothetical protein
VVAAGAGDLLVLEAEPFGSVLALVPGNGALNPKVEPATRRCQVVLAGHGGELGTAPLREVDQALVLDRLTGQPIGVPGDDGADAAGLGVGEQALVAGSAAVERREVVVPVDLGHLPAVAFGQFAAGRLLALDAECRAVSSSGDPHIDPCSHGLAPAGRRTTEGSSYPLSLVAVTTMINAYSVVWLPLSRAN